MNEKKLLALVLRLAGLGMLGALVFVFCPFGWMQAIHEWIGMGQLEYSPLISYLTRTLAALYAIIGSVFLVASTDLKRYRPLIKLLGLIAIFGGVGVTVFDWVLELPMFWTLLEGPLTALMGAALLLLSGKKGTR